MNFTVILERQAERDLRSLPDSVLARIDEALRRLAQDPYPRGALKLKGKEGQGWRVRVGDYRILYTVDEAARSVTVYQIGHRKDVYR